VGRGLRRPIRFCGGACSATVSGQPATSAPPLRGLLKHALAAAVPFVGFGFMDELVMITVGDQIDYRLGSAFGIRTLTAAAMGQVVSDTTAVIFGDVIERLAVKMGLPTSGLSPRQLAHWKATTARTAGAAFGVAVGCLLGMCSLFFLDLDKRDKAERIKALQPLIVSIVDSCHALVRADHCRLWLLDKADPRYIVSWGVQTAVPRPDHLREAFYHVSRTSAGGVTAHQLICAAALIGRETNVQRVEEELIRIEKELGGLSSRVRSDLNEDRAFSFDVFAEYMRLEVAGQLEERRRLRPGGVKDSAIVSKRTVLRDSVAEDPRFNKAHNQVTGVRTRNILVSPIINPTSGAVLGLIEMANKTEGGDFHVDDVKTVELMAKHTALILEKAE